MTEKEGNNVEIPRITPVFAPLEPLDSKTRTKDRPKRKPSKRRKKRAISRAKKTAPKVVITIDVREQGASKIQHFLRSKGWDVRLKMIPVGDYIVESDEGEYVIIERKTAPDLFRSLIDGRLDLQITELGAHEHSIVAIVGSAYDPRASESMRNGEFPQRVVSVLTSLAVRVPATGWRPSLLFLRNENDFMLSLDYIARLLRDRRIYREEPATLFRSLQNPRKSIDAKDPRLVHAVRVRIISSIPGIGRNIASEILHHFDGSLEAVFSATVDQLEKVRGIGAKRAMMIWNFLHS